MMKSLRLAMLAIVALLAGCAGPQRNVDYTAFRESKPASILVLPPLNTSVDVAASAAVLSQATLPLAESGYYVVPVAVMEETFRQNGLTTPDDIHAVPAARLREIFGADAALYMTVKEYGASYKVVSSDVTVSIDATLLDLRSGAKLGRPPDPEARQQQQQRRPDRHAGAGGGGSGGQLVVGPQLWRGRHDQQRPAQRRHARRHPVWSAFAALRRAVGPSPAVACRWRLRDRHQAPFAVLNRRAGFSLPARRHAWRIRRLPVWWLKPVRPSRMPARAADAASIR